MKKRLFITSMTFIIAAGALAQTYVINSGWEDGNVVPTGAGSETTTSYGQQISTNYARAGSHSCRFEVRDSDPMYGGGVRSEMKTDMIFDQNNGDIAWVGYSIYYPSDMVNTPQEEMIGQFMQKTTTGSYSPAVGFKNEGDFKLRCYVRQGSVNVIKNLPAFSFPKGEWVDFVWNIKFSLNDDGYIKGWCNGELKVDYSGKVGYPGSKINFKWGIYPGWKTGPNGQSPRIIYYDNVKVMRNNGSYNDVFPGGSTVKNQTITFPHNVLVYPNPFINGQLTIDLAGINGTQLNIINQLGQLIYTTKIAGQQTHLVNKDAFTAPGIYILSVQTANSVFNSRIIVR